MKNSTAPNLPSLPKSASHRNAQKKCGFLIHFLKGREVLQSQDYGLDNSFSEMVSFNSTLLQFITTRNGLGFLSSAEKYIHEILT